MTSSRCSSSSLTIFSCFLSEKSSSRQSAFQWVRIVFLFFQYSNEADSIQYLLSTGMKQLASRFNLTYRYIYVVMSINNPEFENYLGQMYPAKLEIKDTTETITLASYLDLLLSSGRDCQFHNSIYDKRDDFNIHITHFPFLSSNIPSSLAYGIFISQLVRYALAFPRINVLFWGPGDFPVSYSNRDTSTPEINLIVNIYKCFILVVRKMDMKKRF